MKTSGRLFLSVGILTLLLATPAMALLKSTCAPINPTKGPVCGNLPAGCPCAVIAPPSVQTEVIQPSVGPPIASPVYNFTFKRPTCAPGSFYDAQKHQCRRPTPVH